MHDDLVTVLDDCTEFRQTLLARPPRFVHGTLILLAALLGSALAWAAATRASLIVRAAGRVRPVTTPRAVFYAGSGEPITASAGGRVVEVRAREGDVVRRGELLIRLDTERIDNEIGGRRRTIAAGEEELTRLNCLEDLAVRQAAAVRAKAEAELARSRDELSRAHRLAEAEIRLAQLELDRSGDEEGRLRRLATRRAASEFEVFQATVKVLEARQRLVKARLPVEGSQVEVLRRALTLTERDEAVRAEQAALKRAARKAEVAADRLALANLVLERVQAVLAAPIGGVVTAGDIKVGDLLERGKVVMEIAEQAGFRFEAAVPSGEVAHLRVGMPARVKLDAYDYQRYGTATGTVCFVSPDSGPSEGRSGAMYSVRIELDRDEIGRGDIRGPIKLGMAGSAEIITGHESLLRLLLTRIRRTISLS